MADDMGTSTMDNEDQGLTSTEDADTTTDAGARAGIDVVDKQSAAMTTVTADNQPNSSPTDGDEPPSPSLAVTPAPAERKSSAKTGLDSPSQAPGERKSLKSSASATVGERKDGTSQAASQAASQHDSKAVSKVASAKSSNADQTKSLSKKSSHGTAMDDKSPAEEKSSQQNFYQGPFAKISPFDKFHFMPKDEKAEVPEKLKIENTSERVIIFKIKTTAPEGYRVRPSLGVVQPGSAGEVDIFLQPGRIKRASEDRFLVMVMQTDTDSMTQQQIAEAFKNVNKEQNKTMEHRLSCQVGSDSPKDGNSSGPLKTPRGSKSDGSGMRGGSGGSDSNNRSGGSGSDFGLGGAISNLLEKVKNAAPGARFMKLAAVQAAVVTVGLGAAGVFYSGYVQGLFAPAVPLRSKRVKACWPWS